MESAIMLLILLAILVIAFIVVTDVKTIKGEVRDIWRQLMVNQQSGQWPNAGQQMPRPAQQQQQPGQWPGVQPGMPQVGVQPQQPGVPPQQPGVQPQQPGVPPQQPDIPPQQPGIQPHQPGMPPQHHQAQVSTYAPPAAQPVHTARPAPHPQPTPPQAARVAVAQNVPPVVAQSAPTPQRSWESWVGRNVIGIIASILVFLGMIFLGILVVPRLGEGLQIALMFALSAAFTVVGFLLVRKNHNNFTVSVLGTGCGAFFISILLTHLFFSAIGDLPALALLLVWLAASLGVARVTQSVLVSIIAHVGAAISICYSFALGMSDEKLLILLGYQLATTAVIVGGNILCCRKTYRFGLFISLALTVVASLAMWGNFGGLDSSFESELPTALIAAAFTVQFVVASFLSYLLFVSTVRVENKTTQLLIHAANKLLWLVALGVNVPLLGRKLSYLSLSDTVADTASSWLSFTLVDYYSLLWALVPLLVCLFGHIALTVLLRRKLDFPHTLEMLSVFIAGWGACIALLLNYLVLSFYGDTIGWPAVLWLILVALVFAGLFLLTKTRAYQVMALALLVADFLHLLSTGFAQLTSYTTIVGPLVYLAACLILVLVLYLKSSEQSRLKLNTAMRLTSLLAVELGLLSIFLGSSLEYRIPVVLLCLVLLLLAVHFTRFERDAARRSLVALVLRVNELVIIYASAYCIAFTALDIDAFGSYGRYAVYTRPPVAATDTIALLLYVALAALCLLVLVVRFLEARKNAKQNSIMEVCNALGFTLLVLAVINGTTNWFNESYVLSLVVMMTALTTVLLGFWSRIKVLRLYGLVVMIVSIVKLVTLDVSNADSVMRVVAFIGGGLICFAISALYNFAVKRLR
jgi:hypothetical protein